MLTIIVIAVLFTVVSVVAVAIGARRSRRGGPAFSEQAREDQVQAMRNREAGSMHQGSRDSAKATGPSSFNQQAGPWG
jgi:hypothetical protein